MNAMHRLSKRSRRRRSGSTRPAVNAASLPDEGATGSTAIWTRPSGTDTLAGGAVVRTSLVARLLGVRLLTVEGTVLLSPASFGAPPADIARTTARTTAQMDARTVPKGIGARLGPSARLIDESIDDLRALDH